MVCSGPLALFRCLDCCQGQQVLCCNCCLVQHQHLPFHRIQRWTGKFFEREDLGNLGLLIHFGHDGNPCPTLFASSIHTPGDEIWEDDLIQDEKSEGDVQQDIEDGAFQKGQGMVFVTTSGVYKRQVQWCNCEDALPAHMQLLCMRFFSSTLKRPSTAFTFDVLDQFHIETLECHTSAHNFYTKLQRITYNRLPSLVPVHILQIGKSLWQSINFFFQDRYRELMRVSREWRYLKSLKRTGFAHKPNQMQKPGDLALFCPSCPQPGINVSEDEVKYAEDA